LLESAGFPVLLVGPRQVQRAREVYLPYAFDRKDPHAGTSWAWQYVFPAAKRPVDARAGVRRRHHGSETVEAVLFEGSGEGEH
jgi:hypothetical protein